MPRVSSKTVNTQEHLDTRERINLGSFYTPRRYVELAAEWLAEAGVAGGWTIADLSCGYGAFFALKEHPALKDCRYLGNDIDEAAVAAARSFRSGVEWRVGNALSGVSREAFGFAADEKLALVGNPPYNDITSQARQALKGGCPEIDRELRTRDLGLSSLLAYGRLQADYVAVLHPLSYLVKKSNFRAAGRFFADYRLMKHIVFCSSEFSCTSKVSAFPVIAAFYRRTPGQGITYDEIRETVFRSVEGDVFSIGAFDYVTELIPKYPGTRRYSPEILFYTLRDINALKRSRTFISGRMPNAVDVPPELLEYYCYVDCFKRYALTPYWMGNMNVPFIREEFQLIAEDVKSDAFHNHPDIFGAHPAPSEAAVQRIRSYISRALTCRRFSR